jgi:recombinational DNA repair protein (RecF pathway)
MFAQANLEPLEPYIKNTRPRRCRCITCGRETAPTYSSLKQGNGGCKYCAGRAVVLAEVDAAFTAAGLQPLEDYAGADAARQCRCANCGNVVAPSWTSVKQGKGCAFCAGRRVTPYGVDQIFSDAELEPLEPYVNAKTQRRSRCLRCGTVVFPTYDNLKQGQGGCASCAEFGFNPTLPSILYLLEADEGSALKIGIAKRSDLARGQARLDAHSARGWHTVRVWALADGEQARQIERDTLRWWRDDLGLPPVRKRGSGFTETVAAEHMTVRRVVRYVNKRLREMSICDSPVKRVRSAAIRVSEQR